MCCLVVFQRSSHDQVSILVSPSGTGGHAHGAGPKAVSDFKLSFNVYLESLCLLYHLVSDTVIEFQGLTVVQVSQNQAAVVSDPQNQVFVVRNSGFVAYAMEGSYDVLSIVDQTHLPTVVKDRLTGITLGWTHEVKMKSKVSAREEREYVVATLSVHSNTLDDWS
jgi:hypothetical protein